MLAISSEKMDFFLEYENSIKNFQIAGNNPNKICARSI